jgi:hypothetical protein
MQQVHGMSWAAWWGCKKDGHEHSNTKAMQMAAMHAVMKQQQ